MKRKEKRGKKGNRRKIEEKNEEEWKGGEGRNQEGKRKDTKDHVQEGKDRKEGGMNGGKGMISEAKWEVVRIKEEREEQWERKKTGQEEESQKVGNKGGKEENS